MIAHRRPLRRPRDRQPRRLLAAARKKIHIDIDPSLDQQERAGRRRDRGRRRAGARSPARGAGGRAREPGRPRPGSSPGGRRSASGRRRTACATARTARSIKPQYAIQRLYELTKDRETYITTDVGQHQMWAAQHYKFEQPRRWMTSGGLGTMGYGLPAAMGVQVAHPDALVSCIAGEASWVMNMQEMSTAMQYRLPVKIVHPQQQLHGHGPPVAGVLPRQPLQPRATWTRCRTS